MGMKPGTFGSPSLEKARCKLPPPGWQCIRSDGHDGPCAALTDRKPRLELLRVGLIAAITVGIVMWLAGVWVLFQL